MDNTAQVISQLFTIRNQYGAKLSSLKMTLLNKLSIQALKSKEVIQLYNDVLHFLIAYPDNRSVYELASQSLRHLHAHIVSHRKIQDSLYNSGITGTELCAAFSFEIVKWLRNKYPTNIKMNSFEADDGHIRYIISSVLPKVESEILQDANQTWKSWLTRSLKKGEDLLDKIIGVFDAADMRPEARDELWNAIGINVEVSFSSPTSLPETLIDPYFHHSLIKKDFMKHQPKIKPIKVDLSENEAEQIIGCGRMVLIRHLREIEPISFTAAHLVSYYRLPRGLSIALMGMVPERRHPIDSYMGYVVFKNGMPVSYAGSWILFDSARIGLNIFPAYRGGESHHIFYNIMKLHKEVYHLKRFSVDPYQIGKENEEGLRSGAFWIYYHAGFRPMRETQKKIAEEEQHKIRTIKGYRSPVPILKKLASSRLELSMEKQAVRFDAGDLSVAFANILTNKYKGNRKVAEETAFKRLVDLIRPGDYQEEKMKFILKNWCVLLLAEQKVLNSNPTLRKILKKLFELKAGGDEEAYISGLQHAGDLRKLLERIAKENGWPSEIVDPQGI